MAWNASACGHCQPSIHKEIAMHFSTNNNASAGKLGKIGIVTALHLLKVGVAPWTVNDEAGWARALELGVDAIITDYPEDLVAYLKKRGL